MTGSAPTPEHRRPAPSPAPVREDSAEETPEPHRSIPRGPLFDGAALFVALFLVNLLVAPGDPGWTQLNPTPWLLLPVFLGARYGGRAGFLGGALVVVLLLVWHQLEPGEVDSLFQERAYLLLTLLAAGWVTGAAYLLVAGPTRERDLVHEIRERAHDRLESTVRLLEWDRQALKRALLLQGASFASLPEELTGLLEGGEALDRGFLSLLERHFGIRSAALYSRSESSKEPDDTLRLRAFTGEEGTFPGSMGLDGAPGVVAAAWKSGELATCRQLWEGTPDAAPVEENEPLAALPYPLGSGPVDGVDGVDGAPRSLLVIRRMDFDQIHWENWARVEALWSFAAAHRDDGQAEDPGEVMPLARFQERVRIARELRDRLFLDHFVFRVDLQGLEDRSKAEVRRQLREHSGLVTDLNADTCAVLLRATNAGQASRQMEDWLDGAAVGLSEPIEDLSEAAWMKDGVASKPA